MASVPLPSVKLFSRSPVDESIMSLLDELTEAESMPHGLVNYRSGAGVALICLNNEPANGYSHEMMLDLDRSRRGARGVLPAARASSWAAHSAA